MSTSELMPRPSILPRNYSRIEPLESPSAPPENELSIFKVAKEVLSSVKPGSDVTNVNLPASVLDPVSTLEKTKKSMQRGELIQDICNSKSDEITRFLNVIKFNISGLARERFGKKPYNPILGEIYRCCFVHRNNGGTTLLVAEQVSHHPPITALHLRNEQLGFYMNSYTKPEPRFWGNSLEVRLQGFININLKNFNDGEQYVITRPYILMTGFIAGRQRLEFIGSSTIECKKTNLGAEIEYKAKGSMTYRNDALNGIAGKIYELKSKKVLYTLDGNWDKTITLTNVQTNEQSVLFDYESIVLDKSMVAIVPPENELEDSFSTVIWKDCSKAILSGETMAANAEKRRVEEHQRMLRKDRNAANITWEHHYFCKSKGIIDDEDSYDLREDLKQEKDSLFNIKVPQEQLKGLKSGALINGMMDKMGAEAANGSTNNNNGGRRNIFKRLNRNR